MIQRGNYFVWLLILCYASFKAAAAHAAQVSQPGSELNLAEADRVCSAYLTHPKEFEKVKTDKCDCRESQSSCSCGSFPGSQNRFALFTEFGTCQSTGIKISTPDGGWAEVDFDNSTVNDFGMGSGIQILKYEGELYALIKSSYGYIEYLSTFGETSRVILCGFVYQLDGWKMAQNSEPKVCQKFQSGDYDILGEKQTGDMNKMKEMDQIYGKDLPPQTHVGRMADIDLAQNGKMVRLLTLDFWSGAGCGCDRETLGAAPTESPTGERENEVGKIDQALEALTEDTPPCDEVTRWNAVGIDGKTFIAQNIFYAQSHKPIPNVSIRPFGDQVLYEFDGNDFNEICRMMPQTERVIDRKVRKKDELDYTPVDE